MWQPQGILGANGFLDFAGGVVIHTSSGISALVVSLMLKTRLDFNSNDENSVGDQMAHNLPLSMVGAALIWGGWYSFNGGSAFAANSVA